ncbi:MAG: hypothetical protein MUP55_00100 [Candidatus Aenigmarchaeota archaeon]|nr:hypothetical protein [Candidatus Aenigmarchaeota archaeon]
MAELEILEALVGFFCPTSEAASTCREFISNHSQVLPPIGPLFYFLLFPIVFTILFIYILSSSILSGGKLTKGMQLLIGISVFIFIIISGWYPVMLVLSEFWFIMIIVLFGAWYFIGKHRGGETKASKGGGGLPGLGGAMGGLMKIKSQRDEIKLGTDSLNMAARLIRQMEDGTMQRSAENMREVEEALRTATATINSLLLNPLHTGKAMELEKKKVELEKKLMKLNK